MTRRNTVGLAALGMYVACIWLANYFIAHVGHQAAPGAPHVVPVGFGQDAPSGVLVVGLALTLRDIVQRSLGRWPVVAAILLGAALSYLVAPAFAFASGAAFLLSESLDLAVFTPLADRGRLLLAVVASNVVGAVADSVVFLWLAFHSLDFLQGQVLGKWWMTLAALPLVAAARQWTGPSPACAT